MRRPRTAYRRRPGWAAIAIASSFVVAIVIVALAARAPDTSAAPGPSLSLDAPARVAVGEQIEIAFSIRNASDIAGYEMNLGFDTAAAHLNGLLQRQNDINKLGRDVHTLTPAQLANGVTFGAYSCPVNDCTDPVGKARLDKGARGNVRLGTVTLVADQPGTLTIDLRGSRFVDANGNSISVDLGNGVLAVQVDEGQ